MLIIDRGSHTVFTKKKSDYDVLILLMDYEKQKALTLCRVLGFDPEFIIINKADPILLKFSLAYVRIMSRFIRLYDKNVISYILNNVSDYKFTRQDILNMLKYVKNGLLNTDISALLSLSEICLYI